MKTNTKGLFGSISSQESDEAQAVDATKGNKGKNNWKAAADDANNGEDQQSSSNNIPVSRRVIK